MDAARRLKAGGPSTGPAVALRDAYRQRDASREAAARACHRIDASARGPSRGRTRRVAVEGDLAERLSAVVAADDHTATARAKRSLAATRSHR